MNKELSIKLTRLEFILSIFIVLIHSREPSINLENCSSAFYFQKIIISICDLAVPLFFFISGYLFFRNIKSINIIKNKIKKRLNTLLIPFLFWNLISTSFFFLLFFIYKKPISYSYSISLKDFLEGLFCNKFSYLWFIQQILFYNILFSYIIFYLSKKKTIFIIVLFTLYVALVIYSNKLNFMPSVGFNEWKPWSMCIRLDCLFYYLIGCFISFFYQKIITCTNFNYRLFICSLILSIFCYMFYSKFPFLYFNYLILGCISLFEFGNLIKNISYIPTDINYSFPIYLMHQLPLDSIQYILHPYIYSKYTFWRAFIDFIIIPSLVFFFLCLAIKAIRKYVPKFAKIIYGNR